MKLPILLVATLALNVASALHAEESTQQIECLKSSAFLAPPDSPDHRQYVPDRAINVLNLAIDVTPDFTNRTVTAKTTIKFKPIAMPLPELALDAVDLRVTSLQSSETLLEYQVTDAKIIVTFAQPIPPDKEAWVAVEHHAEPVKGLYFRTPEMGYKPGDTHLFTQGEPIEARHWYPCPDAPNQKFTSEITCRVPEGMTVISNGRKVSEATDAATGLVTVTWRQEKPHANYLISLCAGYFEKLEDRYRDIPLAFYTPPSDINEAMNSFRDTKDMLAFFEEEIGVPYPWPKYDQVVVNDFVAGGMENTSATTLTDRTLFTDATENLRSSQGLVAHELAHQWFGDLVTCKDWSSLWLNEGFATYYAHLYDGHKHGRDFLLYGLYSSARGIVNRTDARPIVERKYDQPTEMFSYLAYQKGGWVLHMLRSQLGEDLYRRCIKTWLERHAYGSVVTEDLNRVIEELSGRSYDQFFDQWVYHGGVPDLESTYAWDARTKLARVSLKQNQRLGEGVLLFNFPLTVRFKTKSGTENHTITVKQKSEDFYFPLAEAPIIVRIDPEYTLLARVKFDPPAAMLEAQLEDQADVIGRLLAVEALSRKRDKQAVTKLKRTLNHDPFYGVRVEAAKALRTIHSDEALDALLAATKQTDARVRREVFDAIGGFYHEKAYAGKTAGLKEEKNPDIQAAIIEELGGYPHAEMREILGQSLNSTSYRNGVADAAVRALRRTHDPTWIEPLMQNLRSRQADYTSRGFASALDTLALLARDEAGQREEVRDFVVGYVNDPRRPVRVGALNALGTLEDQRAVAVLQKFSLASAGSPEHRAATNALHRIANAKRPVEGLGHLQTQVLDLQKENRELRQNFKTLEQKLDALTPTLAPPRKPTPALTSPRGRAK
ncbi:MAG: HEAT repeat domain-containing protein [Verrucomicrobiae bacterium]|nr:HEAT repeat domain-containing protein [Verrucomicrobiae bacterium]